VPKGASAIVTVEGTLPEALAKWPTAAGAGRDKLAALGMLGMLAVVEEGQFAAKTSVRPAQTRFGRRSGRSTESESTTR
jgi:hypothetical protein